MSDDLIREVAVNYAKARVCYAMETGAMPSNAWAFIRLWPVWQTDYEAVVLILNGPN